MKRKIFSLVLILLTLVVTTVAVFALFDKLAKESAISENTKREVFELNLITDMAPTELSPGDSFVCKPRVYNDALEPMYVFIEIDIPQYIDENSTKKNLYSFEVNSDWKEIDEVTSEGKSIYAYTDGSGAMVVLDVGVTSNFLTEAMVMDSMSNAIYAGIDDINVTITAYAISPDDTSDNPYEAWQVCKQIDESKG